MTDFMRSLRASGASSRGMLTKSIFLLGLVYLIVISSYVEGPLNPILLTALLLFFLFSRSRGNLGIEIPSMVFILVLILTSFTSIDPQRSFYEVWLIGVGIFLIFATARIVQGGFSSHLLVNFLLIVGLGLMIFSWADAGRWYLTWKSSSPGEWIPGISFRLNGGNTIAAYYHAILMIGLARLVYSRSRMGRLSLGGYCLSAASLIFLSSSRGAYISVLGGLFILVYLQWKNFEGWMLGLRSLFHRHRYLVFSLGAIALLLFAGVAYWYLHNMQAHPTHGAVMQSRNEFWGPAWKAFLRSPWIGNGPYTFASDYMNSVSVPPSPIFLHAHNAYLDILSGSGLVGFLISGWLIGTLLHRLWNLFHIKLQNRPDMIFAALLALSSFLIHSFFDGLYLMPLAAFNLCILIGSALGETKDPRKILSGIPVGIGVVVVAMAWVNLWMTTPYQKALQVADNGNLELAAEQFSLSIQRDPWLVLSQQQLGLVESIRASEGNSKALASAIQAMERAVALDSAYSVNHANLGALYKENGKLEQATEEFKQALELAPGWGTWHLNLGEVYEMQEKWDLSAQAYEQALTLESDWVADGFWTGTAFRSEISAEWQEMNSDIPEEKIQYAEEQVRHQPSAVPILELAAQEIEEQDLPPAERLLDIAQLAYFQNPAQRLELVWLKAEIAAAKGDWAKAISLGEEAMDGFRLQGAYGPGSTGKTLYGTGIFRLGIMKVELVPQLTLIHLPAPWPQRMVRLGSWYQKAGDPANCRAKTDELLGYVPDFFKRFPDMELDCIATR